VVTPYYWHGWKDKALNIDGMSYTKTMHGPLKGFILAGDTKNTYSQIVNLIQTYTTSDDIVFQFPHITLFNVITERKTAGYMPVLYFDVCTDELAASEAKKLYTNYPKMVIWCDLAEDSWLTNESIFRGGKRSGQRAFQDFYNEVVKQNYKLLLRVTNNTGGHIEVWLLNNNV